MPLARAAGTALGLGALWPTTGPRWAHVVGLVLITTLFDQLFGSYLPPRLDPAPVGSWSMAPDYPQRDLALQLLSPFGRHWQRIERPTEPAPG